MKDYGLSFCEWCGDEFRKGIWNQKFCKKEHQAPCADCGTRVFWHGSPKGIEYPNGALICVQCRTRRTEENNKIRQLNHPPEHWHKIVAQRKKTMLERYGGETTLQSETLRRKRDQTMLNLYGGTQVKTSDRSLLNAASKRSKAKGIPFEVSLEISELLNDTKKLEKRLQELFEKYKGKFTYLDLAFSLDKRVDTAELSHKMSKLPEMRERYITTRDSPFELIVVRNLKNRGLVLGKDFKRHYRLPSRQEIDILIAESIGIEVNDFATHSKTSEEEISEYRYRKSSFKSGPRYHDNKVCEAAQNGINLHFVWEDSLFDGSLDITIDEILNSF